MTGGSQIYSGMNVVVMAGGTGGHVFPALSVAKKLREGGAKISWLGTQRGIESTLVPQASIHLHCLTIEGVRGRGLKALLKAPFLLLSAVLQARKVLKQEQATVVLGLGGFASGPGGVAAKTLGIPVVIHEQNAVAGTTNRWLSRVATYCLEAFPGSLPNAKHVGNPVRENIGNIHRCMAGSENRNARLLVLGGSLGALALNEALPSALAKIDVDKRPEVLHQCGPKHLQNAQNLYQRADVAAEVTAFIDDMAAAYEWADFVVCRAGALTVSELTMAGRAALLVPYPFAIDDHQAKNAEWLVSNDAAYMVRQDSLTVDLLKDFILKANTKVICDMANNAKALSMPHAAEQVAAHCKKASSEIANGK